MLYQTLFGLGLIGAGLVDGATQYFLGDADGTNTPFPLDTCVVDTSGAYEYECGADGTIVFETFYDGATGCSGSGTVSNYTADNATFSCEGAVSYAELALLLDYTGSGSGCSAYSDSGVSSALAVDVCYYASSYYWMYSCTDENLTLTTYSESACSSSLDATAVSCEYLTTVSGFDAYYDLSSCVYGSTTIAPSTTVDPSTTEQSTTEQSTTENNNTRAATTRGPTTTDVRTTDVSTTDVSTTEYLIMSNYFYYPYFGLEVPFPIGVCVDIGIEIDGFSITTTYGVFSCSSDGSTVTLRNYGEDDTCSSVELTVTYSADNATFECEETSSWASLDLSVDCSFDLGTLYAAVGACFEFVDGNNTYYTHVTCDDETDVVTVSRFSDSECTVKTQSADIDECTFFVTAEGYDVYYESGTCVLSDVVTTTQESEDMTTDEDTTGDDSDDDDDSSQGSRLSSNGPMIAFVFATMLLFVAAVTVV